MTENDRKSVDALLATGASKFLYAGELMTQLRTMHRDHESEKYWRTAQVLAEALMIAGHCITQANAKLLADMGRPAPEVVVQ